ncbi:hypothetical protein C8J23_12185 [Shewanella chilikensis]|uniref:DUF805 domain-containing protein n=1 Tax=Shewanella chilikensis TaxID=558541 RepID=A0ABX5PLR0_9GAMM|nr:hypothetical protein [Shewanella chilikensis]MCL1154935.1 hypothetical protein [Shewanella chilikensis]PYE57488.1 hypothetical protein C8J23_12185 [Shewanella chilikensis]GGZ34339.1 hypothetical protein GCM10007105_22130 [Shewanella chilikensis]
MLYKSLICIQGYDNGLRHAAISGAVYFLLLVLGLLSGGGSFIWLPGILLAPVLLLSCRRRLGDGGLNPWLSLIALLPWLILLLTLGSGQEGSYLIGALVLALALHTGLALLPGGNRGRGARSQRDYVQGYCGPVPLSAARKNKIRRVEPTLGGTSVSGAEREPEPELAPDYATERGAAEYNAVHDLSHDAISYGPGRSRYFDSAPTEGDASAIDTEPGWHTDKQARHKGNGAEPGFDDEIDRTGSLSVLLLSWRDAVMQLWQRLGGFSAAQRKGFAIAALVTALLGLGLIIWLLWPQAEPNDASGRETTESAAETSDRVTVRLPDSFSLSLDGDLLRMSWLGDTDAPGPLWDLATAKGDRRCAELVFNNGTGYRPMSVVIGDNGKVEAAFSPLDSQVIVQDMARRGSVKLCGYDFSLKGSQAALGSVPAFRQFIE